MVAMKTRLFAVLGALGIGALSSPRSCKQIAQACTSFLCKRPVKGGLVASAIR
jgi:hypothetical protein